MTTTSAPKVLLQHVRLKAPVDRVYRALTDANELQKWFPDAAKTDPRVSGEWRFEFKLEQGTHVTYGRFLLLEPGKLVRYSWYEELDDDGQELANLTVNFRLVADGDETDLYLEESGFLDDAAHNKLIEGRTRGWSYFMKSLESYVVGGPDLRKED